MIARLRHQPIALRDGWMVAVRKFVLTTDSAAKLRCRPAVLD